MAKCPACSTENPDDSAFCTGCGANLAAPAATPAHCTNCGAKFETGSGFCTECGNPVGGTAGAPGSPGLAVPPGDMSAALTAYWSLVEGRLAQAGFEKFGPVAGLDADRAFKRHRFDLVLGGKVTTLCVVKWAAENPTAVGVQQFSHTVFNFADTQKGLLGRGALQPLVVYPVLVSPTCPPDVQAFLNSHWPKRLRSYEFPAVAALASRELFCHRSTPVWGLAFHGSIKREAEALFQP
jgi:hypothetical protein